MTESIATLREQLRQIRQSHAAGILDDATFAALKAPLEQRLVDAVLAPDALTGVAGVTGATALPSSLRSAEPRAVPRSRAGRGVWASASVFVALVALAGYAWMGSPGAIGQPPAGFAQGPAATGAAGANGQDGATSATSAQAPVTREQIDAMVGRLAERLKGQPDDADGWVMLGRSQMALERPAEALAAHRRALALRPNDAGLLSDTADALAAGSEKGLEGEPMQLIAKALQIEPGNLKAMALSGSAAFNRGDFASAAQWWDGVVATGPADSRLVELARGGAVEARQRGNLPAALGAPTAMPTASATAAATVPPGASPAAVSTTAPAAVSTAAATVTGTVSLAAALAAQAAPGDTVFIFARPADGSRMPVAIVRRQVSDLPYRFVLDDSSAMSPAARLSTAGRVVVGARISKSGQAMPQPGDLEGSSEPVAVGTQGVTVNIGRRLP